METRIYERFARLEYATLEVEGARHLVVSFPTLAAHATPPLVDAQVDRALSDVKAHRLYVGGDDDFFFGPDLSLAGFRTATHLVWREAQRLGVPEEMVITHGTSFRAICALVVGLTARAGLVMSGAAPIRLGGWALRLHRSLAPTEEAARTRAALVTGLGLLESDEARVTLDRLILRAAMRARHEADIRLFVSPEDPVYADNIWLDERLRDHPTLRCRIEPSDYGSHRGLRLPFIAHLRATLVPICGLRDDARDAERA